MTKKIQKTIAVGITVVMLLGILPLTAQAAVIMSGPCGDNVNYTLTDDGVLTLSGKGYVWTDMNFTMRTGGRVPWAGKYVRVLRVEEGVTHVSDLFSFDSWFEPPKSLEEVYFPTTIESVHTTFSGAEKLKEVYLPEGLDGIGASTFRDSGLTRIYIPSTVIEISSSPFLGCDNLRDIYFGGTKDQWEKLTAGLMWFDDTETWEVANSPTILPPGVVVHYNAKDNHPLKHLMPNSDSLPSEWARETVKELQKSEIFPSQILPPETPEGWRDPMNRLAAVNSILYVLAATAGYIDTDVQPERFSDLTYGEDIHNHAISYANKLGIAKGKGNGRFDPNGTLTRAELAAMINRAAKAAGVDISGYTHRFNDVKGHWSDKELGFVYNTGIMAGTGGGRFEPNKTLTREECFITSYRFYKWLAEKIGKKW